MRRDENEALAKAAWDSISDEFNCWDALSKDERDTYIEFASSLSAALSIEQTQPVAWMYQFKTKAPVLMVEKRNWAETHSEWTETPLYAHPPTTRIADSAEAGGSSTSSEGGE